ncbi:MAG: prepilin-type N-terminal cleavage/methylation domain-containing protein [Lentisphaeraceae bacterium]|nr:prepilin-type N-terminal cleavage/methylation domain-containing protein [Lentisphaeraceae bacterium]
MKKFTLIELLVVVAIIGILASLLLPSLAGARERGKTVVCLSNVKQIGIGFASYASDETYFPYGSSSTWGGGDKTKSYDDLLNIDNRSSSIISENGIKTEDFESKIYTCPSDTIDRGDFEKRSYSMNSGTDYNAGTLNGITTQAPVSKAHSDVTKPSDTLILSERIMAGNKLGKDNAAIMGKYPDDHWKSGVHNGKLDRRNALFVDGHALYQSDAKIWGYHMEVK